MLVLILLVGLLLTRMIQTAEQSLRYEEFIAPLTKALQEVIAKNEALEARIAALEG